MNITVNVEQGEYLSEKIDKSVRTQIKSLKIKGYFREKYDSSIIRTMANSYVNGERTGGILEELDLSEVSYSDHGYSEYVTGKMGSTTTFQYCSSLKKIILPRNITVIVPSAFVGCTSLEDIIIKNNRIFSDNGVLYSLRNGTPYELLVYPAGKKDAVYTIPNMVSKIAENSFSGMSPKTIILPEVPPTCNLKVFKHADINSIKFVVPEGKMDNYRCNPFWKNISLMER